MILPAPGVSWVLFSWGWYNIVCCGIVGFRAGWFGVLLSLQFVGWGRLVGGFANGLWWLLRVGLEVVGFVKFGLCG